MSNRIIQKTFEPSRGKFGAVVGKGFQYVKQIEQQTGVFISCNRHGKNGASSLVIKGKEFNIDKALSALRQRNLEMCERRFYKDSKTRGSSSNKVQEWKKAKNTMPRKRSRTEYEGRRPVLRRYGNSIFTESNFAEPVKEVHERTAPKPNDAPIQLKGAWGKSIYETDDPFIKTEKIDSWADVMSDEE